MKKDNFNKYIKIVEWSDEDNCFIGSCPELFDGGCHGDDSKAVFEELCTIIEEVIEIYQKDEKPLPKPMSGKIIFDFIQNRNAEKNTFNGKPKKTYSPPKKVDIKSRKEKSDLRRSVSEPATNFSVFNNNHPSLHDYYKKKPAKKHLRIKSDNQNNESSWSNHS